MAPIKKEEKVLNPWKRKIGGPGCLTGLMSKGVGNGFGSMVELRELISRFWTPWMHFCAHS